MCVLNRSSDLSMCYLFMCERAVNIYLCACVRVRYIYLGVMHIYLFECVRYINLMCLVFVCVPGCGVYTVLCGVYIIYCVCTLHLSLSLSLCVCVCVRARTHTRARARTWGLRPHRGARH